MGEPAVVVSWVGPEFDCGECGGRIARWPMKNLLGQEILDWRHVTVPAGVTEHRAVLGTPVPLVALAPVEPADDEEEVIEPDPVPPPELPARPALAHEMPPSALAMQKLAQEAGWTTEAWTMRGMKMDARWKASRVVTSVVLRMRRDGHGLIAIWEANGQPVWWSAKQWPGVPYAKSYSPWSFDMGYSLTHHSALVGSPEMRKMIEFPRAVCEECHEPPALHSWTEWGPACYRSTTAPSPGGSS